MAEHSKIEWTDATWNPITGCSVVSRGCTHCYAMRLAGTRLRHHPSRRGLTDESTAGPVWNGQVRLNEDWLDQPLRWRRPRRIFVCAHGDLFHESVPDAWIDQVFAVMAVASQHTFQVLTKRPERMRDYLGTRAGDWQLHWPGAARKAGALLGDMRHMRDRAAKLPLPNVWLGVSAEDQRRADERIPHLLATPAAVRFLSCEPLLGSLDLSKWLHGNGTQGAGAGRDRCVLGGPIGSNLETPGPGCADQPPESGYGPPPRGELPPSPVHMEWSTPRCTRPSDRMDGGERAAHSSGNRDQSPGRGQGEQPPLQPRVGHAIRERAPQLSGARATSEGAEGLEKHVGQAGRSEGDGNQSLVQNAGNYAAHASGEVFGEPAHHFGDTPPQDLDARPLVHWVIVGGESGPGARPMHPDWARSLRDQCVAAGVPFFFKQWGEWAPGEIAADHLDPERAYKGLSYDDHSDRWEDAWSWPDGHADDEPDVYRLGKTRAGRRLDGRTWDELPASPAKAAA